MEDTTTTGSPAPDASGQDPQLEQVLDTPAEVATEETQTDPSDSASHTDNDEDLAWLRNKGLDPTDPEFARKAAQLARNTEREFHKSRTEAKSQLQDAAQAVTADATAYSDEMVQRLARLESDNIVTGFYARHPDAREMDTELAEILQSKPYLGQDLEAIYAIAKASKYEADLKAAENKGRSAAKADIARASSAGMPSGNASDSTPVPGLTRQAIADMSAQEYAARRDEINAAIASGKLT